MDSRTAKYVQNLSEMIRMETVSSFQEEDISKFTEFHALLRRIFPHLFGAAAYENFDGSFLLIWHGTDGSRLPVLFMNHMDVVEASGEWTHPPFSGIAEDGRLWGRGTLDTKGGLWAMLQAADELAEEGFVPGQDIYFVSSCNEETSGHGADTISRTLLERGIRFEAVFDEGGMILHDPIGGADGNFAMVGVGEKGCADIRFVARSSGGHASAPGKNSPLVRLGRFMAQVEKRSPFRKELNPVTKEMLRRLSPFMGAAGLITGHSGCFGWLLKLVLPSLSAQAAALLQTTVAFTMAKGSDGTNVIPQEAWVIGNMRFSHHQGLEASLAALEPLARRYGIEIEVVDPGFSSGLSDYRSPGFRRIENAVRHTFGDVDDIVPYVMTGASDARYFSRVCDNCLRFLPLQIDAAQLESIHGVNENLNIDRLCGAVDYYKFMMREEQL